MQITIKGNKTMIDDTNEVENEEVTEEVTTGEVGLSINDLANIKQMIDVASSRGAYKPNEMQIVGATYDRLIAFLKSVLPAKVEETAEVQEEEESLPEVA